MQQGLSRQLNMIMKLEFSTSKYTSLLEPNSSQTDLTILRNIINLLYYLSVRLS